MQMRTFCVFPMFCIQPASVPGPENHSVSARARIGPQDEENDDDDDDDGGPSRRHELETTPARPP